jgi:hypothetical protein
MPVNFPLVPTYPYDINLGNSDEESVGEDQSRIVRRVKGKDTLSLNFPYVSKVEFDKFWSFWLAHTNSVAFYYVDAEYGTTRLMKISGVPNMRLVRGQQYEISLTVEYV